MSRPPGLRLPMAPLLAYSGIDRATVAVRPFGHTNKRGFDWIDIPSVDAIFGELVGVKGRCVGEWRRLGIPIKAAEDACNVLGFHPCEVWGDDWIFTAGCPLAYEVLRLERDESHRPDGEGGVRVQPFAHGDVGAGSCT